MYVELKSGYSDNGLAWIGKAQYSKTKKIIYFNGKTLMALTRRQNCETHTEMGTGLSYWVSGVKKDQTDRHWAGSGKIMVDREVADEYMQYVGTASLNKSKYQIVPFDHSDLRQKTNEAMNRKAN